MAAIIKPALLLDELTGFGSNAGEHNIAFLRIGEKQGFAEISRRTFIILEMDPAEKYKFNLSML